MENVRSCIYFTYLALFHPYRSYHLQEPVRTLAFGMSQRLELVLPQNRPLEIQVNALNSGADPKGCNQCKCTSQKMLNIKFRMEHRHSR